LFSFFVPETLNLDHSENTNMVASAGIETGMRSTGLSRSASPILNQQSKKPFIASAIRQHLHIAK